MPVTPAGRPAPPVGLPVRPGLARDDPRWTRPLPWTDPILTTIGPTGILAAVGLALVNAVVPIGILRLLAGRRRWNLRVLMALPVAAAVPLSVFLACEPSIPAQIGARPVSARIVFVLITLAGLPIVAYAGLAGWSLVRRRWRALAVVAAFTIFASVIIGAAWLWQDRRTMPADRALRLVELVPGRRAGGLCRRLFAADRLDAPESLPMAQAAATAGGGDAVTDSRASTNVPQLRARPRKAVVDDRRDPRAGARRPSSPGGPIPDGGWAASS